MAKKTYPKRMKRSESFLGIHFDLHANDDCNEIGKTVTREMVQEIIDLVKPDYIQCDCKGHRGLTSFPSKLGNAAPGFVRDQLKIWREVTAENGVALFMHYSGVYDAEALKRHPSWARIQPDGKRDKRITSVFGPYADKLLIPQLKELSDDYGVDGIWCDGECWAAEPDWSPKVIKAFHEKTGIRNVPKKPEDPHYFEFMEFCREGFRTYLKHYVTEMHKHNPDFQIASNWAFTSMMPEPPTIDVDYISGDYSPQDSVNTARLEARALPRQGIPWDLMAWSFAGKPHSTKSAVQLQQEAAVTLAAGGGFQAYFKQKKDCSIYDGQMKVMAEVAKFCRARQAACHHAEAVPQVGLVFSGQAFYRKISKLFSPWGGELVAMQGALQSLLDSQHSVELLMEHHLAGRMHEYPLLIVPEWEYLPPAFKRQLREYVESGGSLLLIGPRAAAMFKKELRVRFIGKAEENQRYLEHDGSMGGLKALVQRVTLRPGAKAFGKLYPLSEPKGEHEIAASIARCGKGRIAATYFDYGENYVNATTVTARRFLEALVRELFPNPIVAVTGSRYVDVAVNRKDGKLSINLVNTAGPHHDRKINTFDEIPPVGPLSVAIRLPRRPKKITLQPAGAALPFAFSKGAVRLEIPRLDIHDIIVVD
ncbi:MAG: hypothetical protein HQ592_12945 [Planctomycetes bacterium]|nr:hypothetical protein [Planctomycetota bacterium]